MPEHDDLGAISADTVVVWFRNDLRLHDQSALLTAQGSGAKNLVLVHCRTPADQQTQWGFARKGPHRLAFENSALRDLASNTRRRGNPLLRCEGNPAVVLPVLAAAVGASAVVCEDIAVPYEQAEVAALQAVGLKVHTVWQSSLFQPETLPWPVKNLPPTFTAFRQEVVEAGIEPRGPLRAPSSILPPPPALTQNAWEEVLKRAGAVQSEQASGAASAGQLNAAGNDIRSSFPYGTPGCDGGETAALAHVDRYFRTQAAHSYKATRNGLTGFDFSSKFSPWLATGALSARYVLAALRQFEREHGASDGTYWLWFELLWRDYFRLLHLQWGASLYSARGLSDRDSPAHHAPEFVRWCNGETGEPLVDAAMRELSATGYLSNRMRQVVASYLIYELRGDWRAGAAWFESQLVDYDPYSNQGNWLYISGRGTDPRGGRRFNPAKQAQEHDADGSYRRLWGSA